MQRSRLTLANILLCVVALSACGGAPPRRTYTGPLLSPSRLGDDFLWRQRIDAVHKRGQLSFSAVVQKRGPGLILLGLTPFGTRAFVLEQTDKRIRFQSFIPQELPFPPHYMLIDFHRVFQVGSPRSDGWHCQAFRTERMCDFWHGQRLHRRSYQSLAHPSDPRITVNYPGGYARNAPPSQVTLTNPWFDYTLRITTLAR